MLEEPLIQAAGFRNVGPEQAPTGFQLRVRKPVLPRHVGESARRAHRRRGR
ncbi:hypothetical protein [Microbacterium elymi]|uniref:Uncharacterized protein n=1 Tax=Microbacterium elymi TaxID=2909587 RepID=A0ABY5NLQ5_9MICO|nr:hypothetical protein [Microbacterium elymi]UUT36118.1 hypothetical protein L2X98_23905 [Microbacterium elymi]